MLLSSPEHLSLLTKRFNRNTKVKFFTKYADGVTPFRSIANETSKPNAYSHLEGLDPEKTCHIAEAADLCLMLTEGLGESSGVHKQLGDVSGASWTEASPAVLIL